jgi:hypothetical protein
MKENKMKQARLSVLMILGALILAACQGASTASPTPTAPPVPTITPTVEVSVTPSPVPTLPSVPTLSPMQVCHPDRVVQSIRRSAPGEMISVVRNRILDVDRIEIWLVVPALSDPVEDGGEALTEQSIVRQAVETFYKLFLNQPCLSSEFQLVRLTLVGEAYNLRFRGSMIPARMPDQPPQEEADVQAYIDVLEDVQIGTITGGGASQTAGENACTWSDLRQRLLDSFGGGRATVALQIAREAGEVVVHSQWVGNDPRLDPTMFYTGMLHLSNELACLDTPVDTLWVVFTDFDGDAHVLGRLDGEVVRQGSADDILAEFEQLFP